jgi:hypothetical protein
MKLTKSKLAQMIKEEMGKMLRFRDTGLDARMQDLRNQLGDNKFLSELLYALPDAALREAVRTIAKNNAMSVGGVSYLEEQ